MGQPNYVNGFYLAVHEHALETPLRWKRPQNIFVNSMSDLFHQGVPSAFIHKAFDVMGRADWHRFQVLTKRASRLASMSGVLPWHPNVWMGVSVETSDYVDRIDHLRATGAAVKFLSLEPLLGPLPGLNLDGVDWVVVGGESGPGARPVDPAWVADIRDQCLVANVPFFFKQWGGRPEEGSRPRLGRTNLGPNASSGVRMSCLFDGPNQSADYLQPFDLKAYHAKPEVVVMLLARGHPPPDDGVVGCAGVRVGDLPW